MSKIDTSALNIDTFTLKPSADVIQRVRAFLNERLQPTGMECENIHLTTVNNIVDSRLTYSQDLLGLGMDTLEWGFVQSHDSWETGVFSQPWTFEDSHRMAQPAVADIEQMMQDLLDEARYTWVV